MKCLFSVAAVAVVLHTAGVVRAEEEAFEPTPAQVRAAAEAFDRGREAYKSEEYVEAAEQFESADSNAPSAAALELAIRARDKAGQLDRAATLAALALARHSDDANIQKLAPGIIQKAKNELFELDIKCDDPCDVTVAGKIAPGRRATDRTVFVGPGKYEVRAGWSGDRSTSKQVEASKGASAALEFQAPEAAAPAAPEAAPNATPASNSDKPAEDGGQQKSGPLPSAVFWVGVGLTAVAGGVTVWSGLDTQNNPGPNKVRAECQAGADDCNSLYQQGVDKQHRTNILIGTTAGLGVATAVIGAFFTDWSGKKSAAPAPENSESASRARGFSIEPWLSFGGGASVGARGRF
ncbi:MAG TPA: hypothetical protein VHV51_00750 [Polyangiaceae bacterium]|jgi:hypothetical protein|nr:hypothetical protein [Polyangiaceae bacterium]